MRRTRTDGVSRYAGRNEIPLHSYVMCDITILGRNILIANGFWNRVFDFW